MQTLKDRLTPGQIRRLDNDLRDGEVTVAALASRFGVSQELIQRRREYLGLPQRQYFDSYRFKQESKARKAAVKAGKDQGPGRRAGSTAVGLSRLLG